MPMMMHDDVEIATLILHLTLIVRSRMNDRYLHILSCLVSFLVTRL
jgi:hypothetical protein